MFKYEDLVSRNFPLLSVEEQENLRRLRVGIAGSGMGSFIAEALCRTGVERFLFIDPDVVEVANLNHQAFNANDVGKDKAIALSDHISSINPGAKIEAWTDFVTQDNASDFVSRVDVVVDCIDPMPGINASLALARACREQKKWFFYPVDLGWGAVLFSFNPEGETTFEDLLGVSATITIEEFGGIPAVGLISHLIEEVMPAYLPPVIEKIMKGELEHYPQPATAAFTAATLAVSALVKVAKKETPSLTTRFDPINGGSA